MPKRSIKAPQVGRQPALNGWMQLRNGQAVRFENGTAVTTAPLEDEALRELASYGYEIEEAPEPQATPLDRVRLVGERVAELRKTMLAELDRISSDRPAADGAGKQPSPQAISDHQRPLADAIRTKHRAAFDALVADARDDLATVRREAQEARPRVTDAAAAEARWRGVLPRLEAGQPLTQVVRKAADVETLLAISEHGPAWVDARSYAEHVKGGALGDKWQAPDHSSLLRSVDARVAELLGDERGAKIRGALEAEAVSAGFEASRAALGVMFDPTAPGHAREAGVATSLSARYAEQQSREAAGLSEDSADDGGEAA